MEESQIRRILRQAERKCVQTLVRNIRVVFEEIETQLCPQPPRDVVPLEETILSEYSSVFEENNSGAQEDLTPLNLNRNPKLNGRVIGEVSSPNGHITLENLKMSKVNREMFTPSPINRSKGNSVRKILTFTSSPSDTSRSDPDTIISPEKSGKIGRTASYLSPPPPPPVFLTMENRIFPLDYPETLAWEETNSWVGGRKCTPGRIPPSLDTISEETSSTSSKESEDDDDNSSSSF